VLFNGVYTYQWQPVYPTQAALMEAHGLKRDQAKDLLAAMKQRGEGQDKYPPGASFQRERFERTQEQIDAMLLTAEEAIARGLDIRAFGASIPNIGDHCRRCPVRPECWARITGSDQEWYPEVVLEDDGDEASALAE
jgi:hypothetical protein